MTVFIRKQENLHCVRVESLSRCHNIPSRGSNLCVGLYTVLERSSCGHPCTKLGRKALTVTDSHCDCNVVIQPGVRCDLGFSNERAH